MEAESHLQGALRETQVQHGAIILLFSFCVLGVCIRSLDIIRVCFVAFYSSLANANKRSWGAGFGISTDSWNWLFASQESYGLSGTASRCAAEILTPMDTALPCCHALPFSISVQLYVPFPFPSLLTLSIAFCCSPYILCVLYILVCWYMR